MIHYTLLPDTEMKALRREYKTRLFIVTFFFVSCAFVIGIISLIPSYILSSSQENKAIIYAQELKKSREADGSAQVEKDLLNSQAIAKKILADQDTFSYYEILQRIVSHRGGTVKINSFQATRNTATSTITVIIEGKAGVREDLIAFKESLDTDRFFSKVELPISDLAKSKDVTFSLRLNAAISQKK